MSLRNQQHRNLKYGDAIREALEQEMERDHGVFVMGLDVDDHKAIFGSTRGLVEKFGAERIFCTPLSEDAMTGVAIGAAIAGLRPVHVHTRTDFLMLCMNQIINVAAKYHYMYGGTAKVPLVIRSIIGKSWGQGAQHSQALQSMFMHVPGLKVVMPSNAHDAKGCLISAIRDDNPVMFFEHRLLYGTESEVPTESYTVQFGKARICNAGKDITIVGISQMVNESLRAAKLLTQQGIKAEVIDPITLVPLDLETILQSVRKTKNLLIVDNGWTSCGASAEIAAGVVEKISSTDGIVIRRMGFAPTTCSPSPILERLFYPSSVTIAQTGYKILNPTGQDWKPIQDRSFMEETFKGPF
ncbi:MAG: alpha-ketoacid dehydrogenase subunit beta [Deltaproteobacteria bacterium]|nr:alpha-ketoacid dehydrogenase subunit beta [Deltaproteobacteria bacterium]